ALAGRGEVVLSDELNHASIIDGCRLSRAETFIYRHRDTEHLEWGLNKAGSRAGLLVTDTVVSLDVVFAPRVKALGPSGAFVCPRREVAELLVNTARPFIFSTAPPPPSVGAALAALDLLSERPGLVEQLRRNAATLREALGANG